MNRHSIVLCTLAMSIGLPGCVDPKEKFGTVYYLDGAGNWGFGVADVPSGLQAAGYQGKFEVFVWTSSFMPAIDQVNVGGNKLRAGALTGNIREYKKREPVGQVNVIALSAGTGVAVWAIEGLPDGMMIDNLVLLGSSLSYNYDMSKALRHIRGKVYVFYSSRDEILSSAVRALGTVDGTHASSAGLRGLQPRGGGAGKIVNIGWNSQYRRYGWTGAHTDATNRRFVQHVIAPRILSRDQTTRTSGRTQSADRSTVARSGPAALVTSRQE